MPVWFSAEMHSESGVISFYGHKAITYITFNIRKDSWIIEMPATGFECPYHVTEINGGKCERRNIWRNYFYGFSFESQRVE